MARYIYVNVSVANPVRTLAAKVGHVQGTDNDPLNMITAFSGDTMIRDKAKEFLPIFAKVMDASASVWDGFRQFNSFMSGATAWMFWSSTSSDFAANAQACARKALAARKAKEWGTDLPRKYGLVLGDVNNDGFIPLKSQSASSATLHMGAMPDPTPQLPNNHATYSRDPAIWGSDGRWGNVGSSGIIRTWLSGL